MVRPALLAGLWLMMVTLLYIMMMGKQHITALPPMMYIITLTRDQYFIYSRLLKLSSFKK